MLIGNNLAFEIFYDSPKKEIDFLLSQLYRMLAEKRKSEQKWNKSTHI